MTEWLHFHFLSLLLLLFGTLHSVAYIFPLSPCLSLMFFPQLFVKPPQTTTLPSCISFSLGWFWPLPPVQCYKLPSMALQAPCVPDPIPWIYLSLPLQNHKGFDLGHTWMVNWFSLLSSKAGKIFLQNSKAWNTNTLATWCKELIHWKRSWCWERLKLGREGEARGWDGWIASWMQWTWVWVGSGIW